MKISPAPGLTWTVIKHYNIYAHTNSPPSRVCLEIGCTKSPKCSQKKLIHTFKKSINKQEQ